MTKRDDADGWAKVPNWIVRDAGLKPAEIAVLVNLISRADEKGQCHPSHQLIARDTGCSRTTAIKALSSLKERGLLTWTQRTEGDGSPTSNLYQLTLENCRPPVRETYTTTGGAGDALVQEMTTGGAGDAPQGRPPVRETYTPCTGDVHPLYGRRTPPVRETYTKKTQ